MEGFGGTSVVKDRAVSVIVEYVLVAHSPHALVENRKIEHESGLKDGMLLSTMWIKPLQKCTPG